MAVLKQGRTSAMHWSNSWNWGWKIPFPQQEPEIRSQWRINSYGAMINKIKGIHFTVQKFTETEFILCLPDYFVHKWFEACITVNCYDSYHCKRPPHIFFKASRMAGAVAMPNVIFGTTYLKTPQNSFLDF